MAVSLAEISRRLEMPTEELEKKSVLSFVAHEIRLAEWDIADIKERYAVSSRGELESNIQRKTTHSHPAWEDLIHWENLENYTERLRAVEQEVQGAG
jgi:hypothetical protein